MIIDMLLLPNVFPLVPFLSFSFTVDPFPFSYQANAFISRNTHSLLLPHDLIFIAFSRYATSLYTKHSTRFYFMLSGVKIVSSRSYRMIVFVPPFSNILCTVFCETSNLRKLLEHSIMVQNSKFGRNDFLEKKIQRIRGNILRRKARFEVDQERTNDKNYYINNRKSDRTSVLLFMYHLIIKNNFAEFLVT